MPRKGQRTAAAVRLAARTVQAIDGCILWAGSTSTQGGYACLINDAGRQDYAHRVAWSLVNGPIPDDMQIHHVCRTRTCCRVDHLEMVSRERHMELEREEKVARHELARPQIRNLYGMGRTPKEIKMTTGATLGFIKSVIKADRSLMNTAQAA